MGERGSNKKYGRRHTLTVRLSSVSYLPLSERKSESKGEECDEELGSWHLEREVGDRRQTD